MLRNGHKVIGENGGKEESVVVESGDILLLVVPGIRVVRGLAGRRAYRGLCNEKRGWYMEGKQALGDRKWRADTTEFSAHKGDQGRRGAVVTKVKSMVRGDFGGFEAVVELLDIAWRLPLGTPLIACRERGGKSRVKYEVITTHDATEGFTMIVPAEGLNPPENALDSGRIGVATKTAVDGLSDLEIQKAGRQKSSSFLEYVRTSLDQALKRVSESLSGNLKKTGSTWSRQPG